MAPPLSAVFLPKTPMYRIPENSSRLDADVWPAEPSCREEEAQESLSHSSFEEYEYFEDHLDKILEQDPFVALPEGQVCSGTKSGRSADTQKLSEAVESTQDDGCIWYCLAVLDEETGSPLRPATDEETEVLARFLCPSSADECSSISTCPPFHVSSGKDEDGPTTSTTDGSVSVSCSPRSDSSASGAVSALTVSNSARSAIPPHKSGGPCDHCQATESPQWRRGPPGKPTLCNACGTRYRRTQQLGTVVPGQRSTKGGSLPGRKRKSATREFAMKQRALKQQRMAAVQA